MTSTIPGCSRQSPHPLVQLLTALGMAAVALVGGCSQPATSAGPPTMPAGTVLAVFDGEHLEPILESEVAEWMPLFGAWEKTATAPRRQRLSLTQIALPRAVARRLQPELWESTQLLARELLGKLESGEAVDEERFATLERIGPDPDAPPGTVQGPIPSLGPEIWWSARDAELGQWILLDSPGCFLVFRVLDRPPGDHWIPLGSFPSVERYVLPYMETVEIRGMIQDMMNRCQLIVVDPDYWDVVPRFTLDSMNAVDLADFDPEIP